MAWAESAVDMSFLIGEKLERDTEFFHTTDLAGYNYLWQVTEIGDKWPCIR